MIDGKTKLYGIIGNPVKHSLSPAMHNAAFTAIDENMAYVPFPVENVADAMTGLKGLGIGGASVTLPHKEAVIQFLDDIDPVAEKIGAINTLVVTRGDDGEKILFGTNTDWVGANKALENHTSLKGSSVVILGAGGSAKAIGFGLIEAGASIEIHSRTEARGRALAEVLGCPWRPLGETGSQKRDILINATSVGMNPNAGNCPVTESTVKSFNVVMDIVYSPLQTMLLQYAGKAGCTCINGLEMLLYQGVAQFELWTKRSAPVEVMREALMKSTGNNN